MEEYKVQSGVRPIERFESKINKTNNCWLFNGALKKNGYGQFRVNKKTVAAHRFSYELYKGKIPENMFVCHSCDVRNCVNPEHLFLGTRQDNMDDMVKKGRQTHMTRELNGRSKLTQEQVLEIRAKYKPYIYNIYMLAKEYGVGKSMIFCIISNQNWSANGNLNQQRMV